MAKGNGKADGQLDLEHELPAAEGGEEPPSVSTAANSVEAPSEAEKLKAERDALLDRLARLQAEFDNARSARCVNSRNFASSPRPMSSRTFSPSSTVSSGR